VEGENLMNEMQKYAFGAAIKSLIARHPNEVFGGLSGGYSGLKLGAAIGLIKALASSEDGNYLRDTGLGALTGGLLGAAGGASFGNRLSNLNNRFLATNSVPLPSLAGSDIPLRINSLSI
jgi:hypothetical protein